MFNRILGKFSKDIGIDLGTANTLVHVANRGIVINEPSVVAINNNTNQILAVGAEAKKMVGKTPSHIVAIRPLRDGIISDFEVAEKMIKYFIDKVHKESFTLLPRPRVVIGVPLQITEVERKAVEDATLSAGAREVYLIEEAMASAIGARLPVQDAGGNLIVDIGGGTTDIAVISLGGLVVSKSLKIAGDELNENIINYIRENFNVLIGERQAENVKIKIGSAMETKDENMEMLVCGRDLISGLPKEILITAPQARHAIIRSVNTIVESIKSILEQTPPELVADIFQRGVILSGGGALLKGLDRLIAGQFHIPVKIADDPLTNVVRGTGIILEEIELLKEVALSSAE
ncbi:MAG: rod shape-determining protein [bacterium]